MQPQMMKDGGLVPPFKLGPYNRDLRRANHAYIRDHAEREPLKQGVKFGIQRGLCRSLQMVRGKDAVWREEARERAKEDCGYQYHEACQQCAARHICDGFHGDYASFFGTDEARPITDIPETQDPRFFIREQEKIVEPEDEGWAL